MPDDPEGTPKPPKAKAIEPYKEPEQDMLLLHDRGHEKGDGRLVRRAIRGRWGVDQKKIDRVIERAMEFVETTHKTVITQEGIVQVESTDAASVGMKIILAANAQDQADDHLEQRLAADKELDSNRNTIRKAQASLAASTVAKLIEIAEEASGKLGDA